MSSDPKEYSDSDSEYSDTVGPEANDNSGKRDEGPMMSIFASYYGISSGPEKRELTEEELLMNSENIDNVGFKADNYVKVYCYYYCYYFCYIVIFCCLFTANVFIIIVIIDLLTAH